MPFTVEDAVRLARSAHAGQCDKSGQPYIGHPLRMMARLQTDSERMVAALHDVLEDSEDSTATLAELRRAGCPQEILDAVLALTKVPGEGLEASMARVVADPLAYRVKRADLDDNTDPVRLARLDPVTAQRLRSKYARSRRLLEDYSRGCRGHLER